MSIIFIIKFIIINNFISRSAKAQILSASQWKMLAKNGEQKTFSAGKKIFSQGDVMGKLYWLQRGSANVTKMIGGSIVAVATISKYTFFGEISYLSATLTLSVSKNIHNYGKKIIKFQLTIIS